MARTWAVWMALLLVGRVTAQEEGFVSLFDGQSTQGWMGAKYLVEDGNLVCPADGGGTLLTEKQYANFVFRFEFRLGPGGNNGVAIRAPRQGNPAYEGMEIQILDDAAAQYANLKPTQYHGSVYDVFPAKRGATRPAGEWNTEEILVDWRHVKVTLNDQVIVDVSLDDAKDPELLKRHPGLLRAAGHLGFMGHGAKIEFRNLRLKELPAPLNVPPPGFSAAFNGTDLTGWKGLVATPPARAKLTPEQLAEAQAKADEAMREHWKVVDGCLEFSGKGKALCTAQDYGDFEMWVDWKIKKDGDSGIYLRGSPQVQIWERPGLGSGGLYNNQQNPSKPLRDADRPIGEWNTFYIKMLGAKVTVYLNGYLVVDDVVMENYWDRGQPIYPTGQIELQDHGNTLWFRNVYLKALPRG
ncbi:MAG: DUF1080 domain-containing protein [Fimbriimonadaceae bacterium]|nr:DUF1080 domain-containing protein [Fimbriimonadaceae bacterium]